MASGGGFDWLASARQSLDTELDALQQVQRALDGPLGGAFAQLCESARDCTGRLILMGVGKSGHICAKIASTLSSTGTPAIFVHPTEAAHGDLGMVAPQDLVLMLSKSGGSGELSQLVPALRQLGCWLALVSCEAGSRLARDVDLLLPLPEMQEAGRLRLAPTATSTAMLALGDALAMALAEAQDLTPAGFASSHPGGRLGRRLSTRVRDLMRGPDETPWIDPGSTVAEALVQITRHGAGLGLIGAPGACQGVFSDGDLRRCLRDRKDIQGLAITEVMTREFRGVDIDELAHVALQAMRQHEITCLVVREGDGEVGILGMYDLLAAGLE